jgi:HlyD family secretion protein
MSVEVLPTTTKREESGFIVAKVSFVSTVPATQEGMLRQLKNKQLVQTLSADGAPFEVRAEMNASAKTRSGLEWSTSGGPDAQITDGTPCRSEIVTRSEPVLQLLIPATRQLFEMMRR